MDFLLKLGGPALILGLFVLFLFILFVIMLCVDGEVAHELKRRNRILNRYGPKRTQAKYEDAAYDANTFLREVDRLASECEPNSPPVNESAFIQARCDGLIGKKYGYSNETIRRLFRLLDACQCKLIVVRTADSNKICKALKDAGLLCFSCIMVIAQVAMTIVVKGACCIVIIFCLCFTKAKDVHHTISTSPTVARLKQMLLSHIV